MSAQANITVFDGASPTVSHLLEPLNSAIDPNTGELVASWAERLPTVPDYASVRVKTTQKKNKDGVNRLFVQVEVPIMETVLNQNAAGYTASPKVAYSLKAQFVFYAPERSTLAERRMVRQLAVNLVNGVAVTTSPNGAGMVPELIDKLITAS